MKIKALQDLLAKFHPDAEVQFADGNFSGPGDELDEQDFEWYEPSKALLIRPPYWTPVD